MTSTPLFDPVPEDDRLTFHPVGRKDMLEFYKLAKKSYWTVEEVDISKDSEHYRKLSEEEKHFIQYVLAFFAASDGIVNINLAQRFKDDVKIPEANYFYNFQIMIEDVHANMYSELLMAIIPEHNKRIELLNAIRTLPVIGKMSEYMFNCIKSSAPFAERLLRMACVEGIFFTGCFCAIYWFQQRALMPGLAQSNELIARDEALHTRFALFLYTKLRPEHKLSHSQIYNIFEEAVGVAEEFIRAALPIKLPEMNADLMVEYIKNQADNLLALIDVPVLYKAKHKFRFMDQINYANHTNFFERRITEYSKSSHTDDGSIAQDF